MGDVEHGEMHKCQVNNVGELFYQLHLDLDYGYTPGRLGF